MPSRRAFVLPAAAAALQVCDALTANLEERLFFRIKVPCT
jgi:hypothetical protein